MSADVMTKPIDIFERVRLHEWARRLFGSRWGIPLRAAALRNNTWLLMRWYRVTP